jgi:FAD-dependent urate hydroxylase
VAREWWGARYMFGAYPSPGQVMCAAGDPRVAISGDDVPSVLTHHLADLIGHVPVVGAAIGDLDVPTRGPCVTSVPNAGSTRRVVLCGDAAVGYMPIAGVGASNAMPAAAGVADELPRANGASVPLALELYQKRCRSVIERSQTASRRLARVMFVGPARLAWARDQLARRILPRGP